MNIVLQSTEPSISDPHLWQDRQEKQFFFVPVTCERISFAFFFGIARNISLHTKNRMNDIYLINWVRGGICRQLFYIAAYKLFQPSIRYNVIYGIILYYMKTGIKVLWQWKKPK